jgi:catechol 2,3-dioxygenase-like lactoylglutathione lyase family enzyme
MVRLLAFTALMLALATPAYAELAPPNAEGLTFGHVHLNVSDIEAQNKFFSTYFGGRPFKHGNQSAIRLPGLLILLNQQAPTGPSQGTPLDHFGFKVPDIKAFLTKWRAGGLTVQNEITGMEGTPASNLLGPDGLRIEVQEDPSITVPAFANHVHFQTPENAALHKWYLDTFSLETYVRGRLTTSANAPGMNLSFSGSRDPIVPSKGRVFDHIGFEFRDLAGEVRKLKTKGIAIDGAIRTHDGYKSVFLTDPSGATIELTQGLAAY